MSSSRDIFWWKCTLYCRGKFKKYQYLLLITVSWLIMCSDWRDWKDINQRQSQLKIKKRNHILHKPFTLSVKLLLFIFLMWTRNCRSLLLWSWRRVTAESQRNLNSQYCATIVARKDIFILIVYIHQRTILTEYRSLRHQTLTLSLNIQKTQKNLSNLKY